MIEQQQMEGKRVCQICNKSFSNGKAMGGHMRSHFAKLTLPTNSSIKSTPPSSSSAALHPTSSSPPASPRSSHNRQLPFLKDPDPSSRNGLESGSRETYDKPGRESPREVVESPAESGQGSLASDITFSDEEGAMCLMMLSRDAWPSPESESDSDSDDEWIRWTQGPATNKRRFECETCNKVFGSYQALGGHRAGHKKVELHQKKDGGGENHWFSGDGCVEKIFKCPYCGKVFESGQALGGHKKVHFQMSGNSPRCISAAAASSSEGKVPWKQRRNGLIDLNKLPDTRDNNEDSKPFRCIRRRLA